VEMQFGDGFTTFCSPESGADFFFWFFSNVRLTFPAPCWLRTCEHKVKVTHWGVPWPLRLWRPDFLLTLPVSRNYFLNKSMFEKSIEIISKKLG
jgi:hypothetical protein